MGYSNFPLPLDDFSYATAKVLAHDGMRQEVKLLAAQDKLEPEVVDHDNWNGGQWNWRIDLALPLPAFRALADADRQTMEERIAKAMREVLGRHDNHSLDCVRILMEVPKAPPTWKADAKAWAEGKGATNQGRVRSTNIAPFQHDGLLFRSNPEILLYKALKTLGVTLAPLPVFVRGGSEYRRLEPDFVLVHSGVMMVVEVDGDEFHPEAPVEAHERLAVLMREGFQTERVRAADCATETQAKACAAKLLGILQKFATNR